MVDGTFHLRGWVLEIVGSPSSAISLEEQHLHPIYTPEFGNKLKTG